MTTVAFIENTNLIRLVGLQNKSTLAYINDAAVQVTVKTLAGVNVVGESWPLSMAYVAGSNGNYERSLDEGMAFVENTQYIAEITATHSGSVGKWNFRFKAVKRVSA